MSSSNPIHPPSPPPPRYSFDGNDERLENNGFPTQSHSLPQSQSPPHSPSSPSAHPDSSFDRLQAARRYSKEQGLSIITPLQNYGEPLSPATPPPAVPPHRESWGQVPRNQNPRRQNTTSTYSNITPGADNFGEQAAGGITGIAMGVADANARESGLEAMRRTGYDPSQPSYEERPFPRQDPSQSSLTPLGPAAFPPGMSTPKSRSTLSRSPKSSIRDNYSDNPYPYNRHSQRLDPDQLVFDPNSIVDDGDDGLDYRQNHRSSMLSLGKQSDGSGGNAALGIMGVFGKKPYDAVATSQTAYPGPNEYDLGQREKVEWAKKPPGGNKKRRLWLAILAGFILFGGIIGGAIGGTLARNGHAATTTDGASASTDTTQNGDLNANSQEIQALMNNKDLHKVFPGIDYTPMYTQYPGCLSYPPSQNNVTRDLAVLSQLTNTIRLYGTDCNQTEMLIHSISQLKLNGTVKVWLGVWQDNNATTNARQLDQLYSILDKYDSSNFLGIIVGNEVLYRKDMTVAQLTNVINDVRSNLTSRNIDLPVASSDLGDNWTSELADVVDYVMANIHPFFAGVTAEEGAGWTWDFWQQHDSTFKTNKTKNIISETGWPSQGGTDCGGATTCTNGSVAGITELNTFMGDWVCQSLSNGTDYFWFEAFDEPWKISYDSGDENWEDHWGVLTVDRVLKDGVVIPDCGGKTVDS